MVVTDVFVEGVVVDLYSFSFLGIAVMIMPTVTIITNRHTRQEIATIFTIIDISDVEVFID